MGVSGQRHAPAELYHRGKDPRYPLDRRLGWPQSRSGRREKNKNGNNIFENVAEFKYLETTVKKKYIHKEVKGRSNSKSVC
jgi:hypothetical protein